MEIIEINYKRPLKKINDLKCKFVFQPPGNIGDLKRIRIPLIRRIYPKL